MRDVVTDGVVAGGIAAVLSGLPSTVHAIATGRDPLAATAAAGTLVADSSRNRSTLIAAAVPVHAAISLFWGLAMSALLPHRRTELWGALTGLGIAAFDLGVVGTRFPAIRALPAAPQVADHVAFGLIAGAVLRRRRLSRASLRSD